MGAQTFRQTIIIKGDAQEAYSKACKESNDYNGHQEGYSGDIQTCSGFKMLNGHPRIGSKAYQEWEDKQYDTLNKWENAGCIEIKGIALKRLKERNGYKGRRGIRAFTFIGWGAC